MCCSFLIALGANLTSTAGKPSETLMAALKLLAEKGAVIRAVSTLYHTPAFPEGSGPDYVNAAALLEGPWTPETLLGVLHDIEATFGRERVQRWGQRTLDLDLIAAGDRVLPDLQTHQAWSQLPLDDQTSKTPDQLILPHPRLQDRAFVLVPLADVAPDWVHPVSGRSVIEMLGALPEADRNAVKVVQ